MAGMTFGDTKDKILIGLVSIASTIGLTLMWKMGDRQEKATEAVVDLKLKFVEFTTEMKNLKDQQSKDGAILASANAKNAEQDKTLVDHERRLVYIERRRN